MTKAQRYANRQYALKNIGRVRDISSLVNINDIHGAHITVYIGKRRIEWWPGNGKWASQGPGTKPDNIGGFEAFISWLSSQDETDDDDIILVE